MEIYICQTCGNVLRSEDVSCSNCRTPFSRHSATAMPVLANAKPAKSSRLQSATDQKSLQTTNTGQAPKKTRATVPTSTSMDSKPSTDPVHDFFETPRHQELPLKNGVDEASLLSNLLNERSNNKTAKSKKENEKPCPTPFLPAGRNGVIAIAAVAASSMLIALGFFFGSTVSRPSDTSQSPSAAIPSMMTMQNIPKLGGMYRIRCTRSPVERDSWEALLNRDDATLSAMSADNGKSWKLSGQILPSGEIRFEKQYFENGLKDGYPIVYTGQIQKDQLGKFHFNGMFTARSKVFKLRQQIATVQGKWVADQRASEDLFQKLPLEPQPSVVGNSNPLTYLLECLDPKRGLSRKEISERLMMVAGVLLGFGVIVATIMLWIFNPHGKLNRMAKNEYIPSQYKSQHNKMMREWSKPLKCGSLPLGTRTEWRIWKAWVPRTLAISPESRESNPHMIILGGSDKGKTRLLASMVCRDIEAADRAVVVIDSDGELCELVTKWAASHARGSQISKRIKIIDPTYKGGSISYNPLEAQAHVNFIDASAAIVHGFKAIYTEPQGSQNQWSQQTANILRNAAMLLMANNKTLTDLPSLLQDNDFRDILLETIERRKNERTEFATLLDSWAQYKKLARTDQWINWVEPILNRVTPTLGDPRLRPILTKPVSDLRLQELIMNKEILLIRIPQGQLDQNGNLLGSLIVTGIKQAAMSLSDYDEERSQPCSIYLDEMNNFIEKDTIEALTQETDKFKIGIIGCCKTLQYLPEDFRNQIIINVGTLLAFALSKKDADMIGPQMFRVDGRKIKHRTIGNFFNQVNTSPTFELISDEEKLNIDRVVGQEQRHFFCYRVGSVAGTFNLKTHDFPDPPKAKVRKKLIEEMHCL
ncbi:MAG: type IV secretion system DNA-binding domain-containing protein [Candidatus Obscuribacterales bacterium]|nr:type IV secretion system DNA-binding domain-containing protein [Candidatus Obscuribacterales bacterium]